MRAVFVLSFWLVAVAAYPSNQQRIIGGSVTSIDQYPTIASLLLSWDLSAYWQTCGGIILNTRSILTAAHCSYRDAPNRWRVRVGSTWANSGGVVHNVGEIITHPAYNFYSSDSDIAIMHTSTTITYVSNAVQPALIAGTYYNLADDQVVWAAGWGTTSFQGSPSEQLRHVQVWTINQGVCIVRYRELYGFTVTDNMLCSGWQDVGGRDQCQQDSGGPLYHNNIVVGVSSWGQCGSARYPSLNVRVSRFTNWIIANS